MFAANVAVWDLGWEPDSPIEMLTTLSESGPPIVAFDGEPLRHLDDLLSRLSGDTVGKSVTVKIVRGGAIQEVVATIGERG